MRKTTRSIEQTDDFEVAQHGLPTFTIGLTGIMVLMPDVTVFDLHPSAVPSFCCSSVFLVFVESGTIFKGRRKNSDAGEEEPR